MRFPTINRSKHPPSYKSIIALFFSQDFTSGFFFLIRSTKFSNVSRGPKFK